MDIGFGQKDSLSTGVIYPICRYVAFADQSMTFAILTYLGITMHWLPPSPWQNASQILELRSSPVSRCALATAPALRMPCRRPVVKSLLPSHSDPPIVLGRLVNNPSIHHSIHPSIKFISDNNAVDTKRKSQHSQECYDPCRQCFCASWP